MEPLIPASSSTPIRVLKVEQLQQGYSARQSSQRPRPFANVTPLSMSGHVFRRVSFALAEGGRLSVTEESDI